MSDEEYAKETGTKAPTFDGKNESWPFFKKKMESHLARLGLSELLDKNNKDKIPKDTDV